MANGVSGVSFWSNTGNFLKGVGKFLGHCIVDGVSKAKERMPKAPKFPNIGLKDRLIEYGKKNETIKSELDSLAQNGVQFSGESPDGAANDSKANRFLFKLVNAYDKVPNDDLAKNFKTMCRSESDQSLSSDKIAYFFKQLPDDTSMDLKCAILSELLSKIKSSASPALDVCLDILNSNKELRRDCLMDSEIRKHIMRLAEEEVEEQSPKINWQDSKFYSVIAGMVDSHFDCIATELDHKIGKLISTIRFLENQFFYLTGLGVDATATDRRIEELRVEWGQCLKQKQELVGLDSGTEVKTPADLKNEWYSKCTDQGQVLDWGKFLKDVRKELWI